MIVPTQISAVTQCPHCSAKFRVRPEQVKLHAGLVRCGACRGIFDAVEHLIEGILPPVAPPDEEVDVEPPRTIIQAMPAMHESPEQAAPPVAAAAAVASPPPVPGAAAAPTRFGDTGQGSDAVVRNLDAEQRVVAPADVRSDLPDYRWRARARPLTTAARVAYGFFCVLALLALAGQAAYFYRDEIASRFPVAAPVLASACEAIGCHLEPPKRAESLGFVGADLAADPAHRGLLIFTATLRNTGAQAVAFPHLVLSLDGLGGEVVVRRVFTPPEFAPATANLTRGLDAGAEVEIKLYLDASQTNVVGFKVDHAYL
jgi:predicted Zn finger-like uncharacterized protein